MERSVKDEKKDSAYDVIHFEAMGEEAPHLEEETRSAQSRRELPEGLRYLITSLNLQEYLAVNPGARLPRLITIKTHSRLPSSYVEGPKKSVITRSAGYDHVESLSERVNIASLREYCVNAVAQTAMKFLYAAAGELNQYERNAATFRRNDAPSFLELDTTKILTVFGVGKIGKRVYDLAEANGLNVRGVDIRREELTSQYGEKVRFVSREEAILKSDVIVNAMNLTTNPDSRYFNIGYFSKDYLSRCKKGMIFINVTRGEIAPEAALFELYKVGRIRGIGLDVFSREADFTKALFSETPSLDPDLAAAKSMVELSLRREANIYVQPHQAFNSDTAARTKAVEAVRHLVAYYRNGETRFDEQLPYYD